MLDDQAKKKYLSRTEEIKDFVANFLDYYPTLKGEKGMEEMAKEFGQPNVNSLMAFALVIKMSEQGYVDLNDFDFPAPSQN